MASTSPLRFKHDVDAFLEDDYAPMGRELQLFDRSDVYCAGDAEHAQAVVVVPDMLGWKSGRIRNVADFFASRGSLAVVPKLSGVSDTAPPAHGFLESTSVGDYFKNLTFDVHIKPKIASVVSFLHEQSITKISIVGFNWGGWVAVNVLASDLAEQFVCGALIHPRLDLEERLYGGSLLALFEKISSPMLLMPAQDDPSMYASLLSLLKGKLPTCETLSLLSLKKDTLTRGDATNAEIRLSLCRAMDFMDAYFQLHFACTPRELLLACAQEGQSEDAVEFSLTRVGKTALDKVKERLQPKRPGKEEEEERAPTASEKTRHVLDELSHSQSSKTLLEQLSEKALSVEHIVEDRARSLAHTLGDIAVSAEAAMNMEDIFEN